jgi:nucleoside-diphosphate-sugar epimerase
MAACAVTGASGYVGSRISAALEAAGWDVRPLGRATGFRLGEAPDLESVDAVVHAAWDFSARTQAEIERTNVEGSRRLLEAARGRRIVFVSTLSAFPGARSLYGQAKLAVEEAAQAAGGAVIRPGLVWDEEGGSLYASLRKLARLPLLPTFTDRKLHPAHADDVAALVRHLLGQTAADAPVVAAARQPLTLAQILRAANPRLRTVPVPWRLVWSPLRALELVGLDPPLRSDSVLSLVSLDERPFEHARAPETPFRPFPV